MGDKIQKVLSANFTKKQSVGMRQKLMLYWITMILAVFALLILILSLMGVFTATEQKLQQVLSVKHDDVTKQVSEQMDFLVAQGVALSGQITNVLNSELKTNPVQTLNNQAEQLMKIEKLCYAPMNTTLQTSPCNGVFLILDATTNTKAEYAEDSRAGLHFRFANLNTKSAVKQDLAFFRGIPDVAREHKVALHNRWNLEFDISHLKEYQTIVGKTVSKLSESCIWTARKELQDTWEQNFLLMVPVLDSSNKVQGVCGVEVSDLYFQLSYPAGQSEYGNLVTIVAPVEQNKLCLELGMAGGLNGTYLDDEDNLVIEEAKYFNRYIGEGGTFLGVQSPLPVEVEGKPLYVVTLIPQESYHTITASYRTVWVAGSLIFLMVTMGVSVFLSWRFVRPISRSLAALQEERELEEYSGISEIDVLLEFIQAKMQNPSLEENNLPPDIEELFAGFLERAERLTSMEKNILNYYAQGLEVTEVAEQACISIHTVRRHNANIYQKLGVGSRDEIMLYIELFRRIGRLEELVKIDK